MEATNKLITAFKNLLEKSTIENLNRDKISPYVCDFKSKCDLRMSSLHKFKPKEMECSMDYYLEPGYKVGIGNIEGAVYIFPVRAIYTSNFSGYKEKKKGFTFKPKQRKYDEMYQIYWENGLVGKNHGYCGYDGGGSWEGICSERKSYAISYGQIFRELTQNEYQELTKLYKEKLCNLDLNNLEKML